MNTSCCFIGHRRIENKENVKALLKQEIVILLEKGIAKFFFGSMSEFDNLFKETNADVIIHFTISSKISSFLIS